MTPTETAAVGLHDAAALWSVGQRGAAENVVRAACDALVAGLDSPTLGMLAALSVNEADMEVPELLPIVLDELGLPPLPRDSIAGKEAVAIALAAQLISGTITPQQLASQAHQLFGHQLPLTERLAELDDEYDIIEYGNRTTDDVDTEVVAEARRLTDHRPRPTSPEPTGLPTLTDPLTNPRVPAETPSVCMNPRTSVGSRRIGTENNAKECSQLQCWQARRRLSRLEAPIGCRSKRN